MAIEKIEAWKTSNGNVYVVKEEAEKAEEEIFNRNFIKDFANNEFYSTMTRVEFEEILEKFLQEIKEVNKKC